MATADSSLLNEAIEAAWNTANKPMLKAALAKSNHSSFEVLLGRAFTSLESEKQTFNIKIAQARAQIVQTISPGDAVSTQHCYDSLVKLHALCDIEMIANEPINSELLGLLQRRDRIITPMVKTKQSFLALRRAAMQWLWPNCSSDIIASLWIASAKLARKAGLKDKAYGSILKATQYDSPIAHMELARWWWHEGHHRRAIQNLQDVLENTFPRITNALGKENGFIPEQSIETMHKQVGKAKLLLAEWHDFSGFGSREDILGKYKEAVSSNEFAEKPHFYLGRYFDKILVGEENLLPYERTVSNLRGEYVRQVCMSYSRSLYYGTKYLYQTLPRLLTLWLDFGATFDRIDNVNSSERSIILRDREANLKSLNNTMAKRLRKFPPYMVLTVLPQLISRVCHPHDETYRILESVIVAAIVAFPQQALWSTMTLCKSKQEMRCIRGNAIVARAKEIIFKRLPSPNHPTSNLINQASRLTDQLINTANAPVADRVYIVSLRADLKFNHDVAPCPLVIPSQTHMTVALPSSTGSVSKHIPFARELPTIVSFVDEVELMNSLVKPRKITIRATDGNLYTFLCKPKDDLRKDARLMEFNTLINKLLKQKKNVESSKRHLHIKTYAVVPLNEECGLIEWVSHVRPFRDIVSRLYRHRGMKINFEFIRPLLETKVPQLAEVFTTKLLPQYPPVFYEWFVDTFSEPNAWYASRQQYSRTLAVMSMVGHILGLGDRHGENILFDETSGSTLHVDFNCLFDKGLTFEKKEQVPFRLTQNLVDALGVAGYEGAFRKTCEITLQTLRSNLGPLMSVLETFLHDPLVEWTVKSSNKVYVQCFVILTL